MAPHTRIVRYKRINYVCMDGVNGVEMMYDSDPNAAKHALYTLKVGGGSKCIL